VQFLKEIRGTDAAQAELDRLIAATGTAPESLTYRALRAALIFETGSRDDALAQFSGILGTTSEDTPQLRDIRVTYARALDTNGDRAAASAEIGQVLAADPSHVEALKMRARWKIAEDKPGEAIIDLRTALNQNARDPGTLTLMAEAHLREGATELAGERLSLAVEASGARAEESLRYAQFLMQQNRPEVASRVLIDARRAAPGDLRLLTSLIEVLVAMKDWTRAEAAVDEMAQFTGTEARATEDRMRTALALAQNRTDEALQMMQGMVESGTANISIIAATVQTQVRSGKLDEARAFLDTELAKAPESPELRILSANLDFMRGDLA
ncbi:MAG: tetratricopeptide repeat protein, partial [Gemmobacter sp.]